MTDTSSATPATPKRSWMVPVLVGLVVLAIVLPVAFLLGGDDEDDEPTGQPAAESSSTAPSSPSSSGTPSESPSGSPSETPASDDPVTSPLIDKAVRAALKARFPAMVPAGVPAGWTVTDASFSAKGGGAWRIDLTDAQGREVVLVQSTQPLDAAVRKYLGADATAAGKVDLSDYGTGVWKAYQGQHAGLGKALASTSVLLHGPDRDTLVTLAEELVTAEDYDLPEAG